MNRKQKVEFLNALQSGQRIENLLPIKLITLIEVEKGLFTDIDGKKVLPAADIEAYLDLLRTQNKAQIVKLLIIDYNQYIEISYEIESAI